MFEQNKRNNSESRKYSKLHTKKFAVSNLSEYGYCVFDEAVKGLEAQLKDLEKAQKFIFMEYHAIEDAEAWHKIQDVLEERVKAGVEVRVLYDDMGSIGFINTDFVKRWRQ